MPEASVARRPVKMNASITYVEIQRLYSKKN
jgi:hypothetical protein